MTQVMILPPIYLMMPSLCNGAVKRRKFRVTFGPAREHAQADSAHRRERGETPRLYPQL